MHDPAAIELERMEQSALRLSAHLRGDEQATLLTILTGIRKLQHRRPMRIYHPQPAGLDLSLPQGDR